uniref:Uncharacterized protein n=1 Tax=Oryzias latipes TaxID=8090 RepID=A0A3P9HQI6_ORYLA
MQKKLSEASSKQSFQAEKRDYKSLFERTKQKVQDLMKDKQALIAAARRETTLSAEEKDIDEISLQVGCLVQELDKRNQELDELRLQVGVPVSNVHILIELRQNVGRLLVSSMPALELDQVNYECNVIDEILEQYLSGLDSN